MRTKQLNVKLNDKEAALLEKLMKQWSMNASEVIRQLIWKAKP